MKLIDNETGNELVLTNIDTINNYVVLQKMKDNQIVDDAISIHVSDLASIVSPAIPHIDEHVYTSIATEYSNYTLIP